MLKGYNHPFLIVNNKKAFETMVPEALKVISEDKGRLFFLFLAPVDKKSSFT